MTADIAICPGCRGETVEEYLCWAWEGTNYCLDCWVRRTAHNQFDTDIPQANERPNREGELTNAPNDHLLKP